MYWNSNKTGKNRKNFLDTPTQNTAITRSTEKFSPREQQEAEDKFLEARAQRHLPPERGEIEKGQRTDLWPIRVKS